MSYNLIVCGTGFASSFFLHKWLQKRPRDRVLVIERGADEDYGEQLAKRRNSSIDASTLFTTQGLSSKSWLFTIGMGGGSNCWWGQTPRMLPEDFAIRTRFGAGYDWPIGYDDLEPYYDEAEELIVVAGPKEAPYPRKGPCPQPAHPVADFDARMMQLFPGHWFATPSARSSRGTLHRNKCCANGVCGLCPVDAKFRVMNELAALYHDNPNVTLKLNSEVTHVDMEGGRAVGVVWREGGREMRERGDLVFLGLNAMMNPNVLLRSGDASPLTGKRLFEQASKFMVVDFAKVENFNGGQHISGLGYMFYAGDQRKKRGATLIESHNSPAELRSENGKWTSRAVLKIVAENMPEDRNQVIPGEKPAALWVDHSDFAKRALDEVPGELETMLGKVSTVENVRVDKEISATEGHIQGTHVMARDARDGVVDDLLRHHRIPNLIVGGSGTFPSGPPTNPSLTIAALSLRAAEKLA